jgi:hypothetical protein
MPHRVTGRVRYKFRTPQIRPISTIDYLRGVGHLVNQRHRSPFAIQKRFYIDCYGPVLVFVGESVPLNRGSKTPFAVLEPCYVLD